MSFCSTPIVRSLGCSKSGFCDVLQSLYVTCCIELRRAGELALRCASQSAIGVRCPTNSPRRAGVTSSCSASWQASRVWSRSVTSTATPCRSSTVGCSPSFHLAEPSPAPSRGTYTPTSLSSSVTTQPNHQKTCGETSRCSGKDVLTFTARNLMQGQIHVSSHA